MEIIWSKTFQKQFKKLDAKQRKRALNALEIFLEEPFAPSLGNHPLYRNLAGKRAIVY